MSEELIAEKVKQGVSGQQMYGLFGVTPKKVAEVRRKFNLPFKKTFGTLPWLKKGEKA